MSVEYNEYLNKSNSKTKHAKENHSERVKKRKRRRDIESPTPKKKHRSKDHPTTALKTHKTQDMSPFHCQTSSLYLPLPPIAQAHPLQGLCAEHLSPLILTYYPPLRGVILSFHNARLSPTPYGESLCSGDPVLARTIDEYAAPHVWLTADFLVFKPERGNSMEGWINLQNEGNIGLVCFNFFTASIERKRLPKDWRWKPGGLDVRRSKKKLKGSEHSSQLDLDPVEAVTQVNEFSGTQGHFEDGDGRRVDGLIRFTIRDMETSRSSGGDNSFLSIEGTLLDEAEEGTARKSDIGVDATRVREHRRKAPDEAYAMSGALVDDGEKGAGGLGPVHSSADTSTISQLLEQVNDIVPLESEEWGLEDYIVEVGGFECLHFQEANQVLKEHDEVWYSILSVDLRYRKASGRHQISTDGKHLIDGVAFGRPFLRRADRPVIRIPPRKRRRLAYDDDEDEDYEAQRQVVVHTGAEEGEDSEVDSDYSEDESSASESGGDLNSERDDVRNSSDSTDRENAPDAAKNATSSQLDRISKQRQPRPTGLGLRPSKTTADGHGNPFSHTSNARLLEMLQNDESAEEPGSSAPKKRRRLNPDVEKNDRHHPKTTRTVGIDGSARTAGGKRRSVRFDEAELPTPPTVRLGSSGRSQDEEDFKPDSDARSKTDDTDESDKENATPGSQVQKPAPRVDSSSSSESDFNDDETSSSGDSETSSDSSSSGEEDLHDYGGATSSSGTSSSSGSSSSSDGEESPQLRTKSTEPVSSQTSKVDTSNIQKTVAGSSHRHKIPVPPGGGKRKTQKRNQRRRYQKNLIRLQNQGILPSTARIADLRNIGSSGTVKPKGDTSQKALTNPTEDAEFDRKRKALLHAISSGGVDQEDSLEPAELASRIVLEKPLPGPEINQKSKEGRAAVEKSASSASERTLIDSSSMRKLVEGTITKVDTNQSEEDMPARWDIGDQHQRLTAIASQPGDDMPASAQKPRARLDKDTSKRLVFGALGLRTPKTQEDEMKIRTKLMKGIGLSKEVGPQVANIEGPGAQSSPLAHDDSWKDKIELSAVECCYDGIELSTPPFPFVQRWDPQQKKGYFTGGANFSRNTKKRKRNNKYYEASFKPVTDEPASKRQQRPSYGAKTRYEDGDGAPPTITSQPDTARSVSDDNLQAVNDQLLRETEETYADAIQESDAPGDLPHLPEDLSVCPDLKQEACSPGSIIAFKQLDMSADTNWQPKISDYRMARIEALLENGTLSMRIAVRDRLAQEKQYDPETGERLYSKFEMPGYNDEDPEDDDGLLELALVELIDPKLIRALKKVPEPSPSSKEVLTANASDNEVTEVRPSEPVKEDQDPASFADVSLKPFKEPQSFISDAEATEQVRKEIYDLIHDAGWRSSIQSNGSIEHGVTDMPHIDVDHESIALASETHNDVSMSPRFNGFSSSPPAEEYQEAEEQVVYPTIKDLPSTTREDGAVDNVDQAMADPSSEADHEAMQNLREDFEKELDQPIIPSTPDEQSQTPLQTESSLFFSNEPEPNTSSAPPSPPHPGDSLKSTIPDSQPPNPVTTSHPNVNLLPNGNNNNNNNNNSNSNSNSKPANNDQDSDSDFPSLEAVFTSFSSQQRPASTGIKHENHSSPPFISSSDEAETTTREKSILHSLPRHQINKKANLNGNGNNNNNNNKPPASSAPPSVPAARGNAKKPSSWKAKLNRYEAAPRSSQDWIGTQVVDLTQLSSDPVVAAMQEKEKKEEDDDALA
ncbi:MAG: hypothetical protein Q9210_005411, partial [Variospora velana]